MDQTLAVFSPVPPAPVQWAGFPAPPFAAALVFPDVEPDVLEREDAVQSTSVWTSFMARTLPLAGRPRLRPVR